jgi:sulfur carrier protein
VIKVIFNDETISLDENQSLAELLVSRGYSDLHFAVAINRCFVPRINHRNTILQEGDVIEMISPMQGG